MKSKSKKTNIDFSVSMSEADSKGNSGEVGEGAEQRILKTCFGSSLTYGQGAVSLLRSLVVTS